uniref:Uncharacterized protein n=1 Tax=Aegilops tauschii subsp. strangulata TaxID=200361 RepID=A0A452Y146_AEGTS
MSHCLLPRYCTPRRCRIWTTSCLVSYSIADRIHDAPPLRLFFSAIHALLRRQHLIRVAVQVSSTASSSPKSLVAVARRHDPLDQSKSFF